MNLISTLVLTLTGVIAVGTLGNSQTSEYLFEKIVKDTLAALPNLYPNPPANQVLVNALYVSKEGGTCNPFFPATTCVPNADCPSSKCKCKAGTKEINGLCFRPSNYGKSCPIENQCENTLKCIGPWLGTTCTCLPQFIYDPKYPNMQTSAFGITATTLGACVSCGEQSTYDPNTKTCSCLGATYKSESTVCKPLVGAVPDKNGIYACPKGTTAGAQECKCNMQYSSLIDGKCTCQGASAPNDPGNPTECVKFKFAEPNESGIYTCPTPTSPDVDNKVCKCPFASAEYTREGGKCACIGASFPDNVRNPTQCIGFNFAVPNSSNIYECPVNTAANTKSRACDCTIVSSQYDDGLGKCVCQGASYPDDEEYLTKCIRYENAVLNPEGLYACPATRKVNKDKKACECMQSSVYDKQKLQCGCVGASTANDEANPTKCVGYTHAALNDSNIYECPVNTAPIEVNRACECTAKYALYDSDTEKCVCQGPSSTNADGTACVAYASSIPDPASPDTAVVCPDKTNANSEFQACVTSCTVKQQKNACTCTGNAVSIEEGGICVPFKGTEYNSEDDTFYCLSGTAPRKRSQSCA